MFTTTTQEIRQESSKTPEHQQSAQLPTYTQTLFGDAPDSSIIPTEMIAQLSSTVSNSALEQIIQPRVGLESEVTESTEHETDPHEATFFNEDELIEELKPRIGAEIEGTTIKIIANRRLKLDYHDKQIAVSTYKFGDLGFEEYSDIPIMDATLEGKDGSVEFRPFPFPLESINKKVFIVYVKWIKTLINNFIDGENMNARLWECKIDTSRYTAVPEGNPIFRVRRTGTKFDSISGFHATTSIPISKFYDGPDEHMIEEIREFYEHSVAPVSSDLHRNLAHLVRCQNTGTGLGHERMGIRNVFKTPIDAIALTLRDQGKESVEEFCREYCESLYADDEGNSYPSELRHEDAEHNPIRHLAGSRKLMPPLKDTRGDLRVLVESRQDKREPIPINKLYHDSMNTIMKAKSRDLVNSYGLDRAMLTRTGDVKLRLTDEQIASLQESIPLDSDDAAQQRQIDRLLDLVRLGRLLST